MICYTLRLAAVMTLGMMADSTPPSETTNSGGVCGLGGAPTTCAPIDNCVYQFDTSLGTLDSIDWTVNESQQVKIDIDNCPPGPPPLISYSYSITTGDSALGSSSTFTGTDSGITYGGCAGFADLVYHANIQLQGVITTDFSQFMAGVETTPFIDAATVNITPFVGNAFFMAEETDYLTVVYDYIPFSSVPEPRCTALITIAVFCGIALVLKGKRGSYRDER